MKSNNWIRFTSIESQEDLCIPDPRWEKKVGKLIEFQLDVHYSESSCKGELRRGLRVLYNEV